MAENGRISGASRVKRVQIVDVIFRRLDEGVLVTKPSAIRRLIGRVTVLANIDTRPRK